MRPDIDTAIANGPSVHGYFMGFANKWVIKAVFSKAITHIEECIGKEEHAECVFNTNIGWESTNSVEVQKVAGMNRFAGEIPGMLTITDKRLFVVQNILGSKDSIIQVRMQDVLEVEIENGLLGSIVKVIGKLGVMKIKVNKKAAPRIVSMIDALSAKIKQGAPEVDSAQREVTPARAPVQGKRTIEDAIAFEPEQQSGLSKFNQNAEKTKIKMVCGAEIRKLEESISAEEEVQYINLATFTIADDTNKVASQEKATDQQSGMIDKLKLMNQRMEETLKNQKMGILAITSTCIYLIRKDKDAYLTRRILAADIMDTKSESALLGDKVHVRTKGDTVTVSTNKVPYVVSMIEALLSKCKQEVQS